MIAVDKECLNGLVVALKEKQQEKNKIPSASATTPAPAPASTTTTSATTPATTPATTSATTPATTSATTSATTPASTTTSATTPASTTTSATTPDSTAPITKPPFTKLSILRKIGLLTLMLIPLIPLIALVGVGTVIGLSFVKEIEFLKVINDEVMSMHESLSNSYSEGWAIVAEAIVPVLLLALAILSFFVVKAIVNKENYFVDVKSNIEIVEAQNKLVVDSDSSSIDSDSCSSASVSDVSEEKPSKTKLSIPERMMNFVYLSNGSKKEVEIQ